jgi:3-(3-hydroxy-phenyl)propionate hydroxylase
MSAEDVDVLIVGGGPTGLTLANILGQSGVRTLLVDRDPSTVDAPRAVSIDDEALRVMQSIRLSDEVVAETLPNYGTRYRSPWGSEFAFVRPESREFGFSRRSAFRQPVLERTLLAGAGRFGSVSICFGSELTGLDQYSDRVVARVQQSGQVREITARFLVGADGASSTTRSVLGIELEGSSFEQRWLVIDADDDQDDAYDTVAYCDHRRPAISLPGPRGTRRWEVLLRSGETEREVCAPEWLSNVLDRLDAQPPQNVSRRAVYSFHARVAARWRDGRVFLAGDAAHLTPPYAGQGMNAGIRDAANLGWKLAGAVSGVLSDAALDSYESERKHHAWLMIDLARTVGRVMTPGSALGGYGRAGLLHVLTHVPSVKRYLLEMRFKPRPRFEDGLVLGDGLHGSAVGNMFPQPPVTTDAGAPVLLDDLIGPGFALIRLGSDFPLVAESWLEELRPTLVRFRPKHERPIRERTGWIDVRDASGLVRLPQYSGRTLLLRPDRYVAGSFADSEAEGFCSDYRSLLRSNP